MRDSGADLKREIAEFREELERRMALTNGIIEATSNNIW